MRSAELAGAAGSRKRASGASCAPGYPGKRSPLLAAMQAELDRSVKTWVRKTHPHTTSATPSRTRSALTSPAPTEPCFRAPRIAIDGWKFRSALAATTSITPTKSAQGRNNAADRASPSPSTMTPKCCGAPSGWRPTSNTTPPKGVDQNQDWQGSKSRDRRRRKPRISPANSRTSPLARKVVHDPRTQALGGQSSRLHQVVSGFPPRSSIPSSPSPPRQKRLSRSPAKARNCNSARYVTASNFHSRQSP